MERYISFTKNPNQDKDISQDVLRQIYPVSALLTVSFEKIKDDVYAVVLYLKEDRSYVVKSSHDYGVCRELYCQLEEWLLYPPEDGKKYGPVSATAFYI